MNPDAIYQYPYGAVLMKNNKINLISLLHNMNHYATILIIFITAVKRRRGRRRL